MKILLTLVALAVAVVIFLSLRSPAPVTPSTAPAGSSTAPGTAPSAPSSGPTALVDGIQTQLDFRVKAATATKITTERNALKQLLTDSEIDEERKRDALARVTALEADVASAREQLIASGQPAATVDRWLKDQHWDEVQEMAKQLKARP